MASSLIYGKYLISSVNDRKEAVVVNDGALFQTNGEIVEIGEYERLRKKYRADVTLGSPNHVVMPGLVNAHHHVGLTPFQLGSPDYPLELWLISRMGRRDVDPYLDALYGAVQMIESGITTVQHLHGMRRGPASAWARRAREVLRAYRDVGMRVNYAFGIRDQNQIVYGDDQDFLRTVPAALSAELTTWLEAMAIPFDDYVGGLFLDLYEANGRNGEGVVRISLAPTNLLWCSDALLERIREYADRYRTEIHIHMAETVYQKIYALRRFGVTGVTHLADLGVLGPAVTLGHGVWLTEADVDLIADRQVSVCHNASSNFRLRSGIAPLNYLLRRGVRVAMGIDEAGINDDRDMLQEMRLVQSVHRMPGHDEVVPSAADVLAMATANGAHATGFGDRIGALEPGRRADVALMRLDGIVEPYLADDVPIVEAVVRRGRISEIDTVLVDGEVVLRDREVVRIDKRDLFKELKRSFRAAPTSDEARERALGRELFPHVRRFYDGWTAAAAHGEPFYTPNGRL